MKFGVITFACRPLAPELEDVYLHYFGAEDGL